MSDKKFYYTICGLFTFYLRYNRGSLTLQSRHVHVLFIQLHG